MKRKADSLAGPASSAPFLLKVVPVAALPVLAAAFVFFPSLSNEFVDWDDNLYITENPLIRELTFTNVKRIFTTFISGNYHPIVFLSHLFEYRYFELNPFPYHLQNYLLHLLNIGLLACLLSLWKLPPLVRFTACFFFAIHPMQLEVIAWAIGRKDLYYCSFFLLMLVTYTRYCQTKHQILYYASLSAFLLSLLSKGMAVTAPVILLLVDYFLGLRDGKFYLREKIPFFALSIVFGCVAVIARASYQHVLGEGGYDLFDRSLLGGYRLCLYYFLRFLIPLKPTAALLDAPTIVRYPAWVFSGAFSFLAVLCWVVLWKHNRFKAGSFGALFFLITISPSLLIVNLGHTADRFAYVPSIGYFLVIAVCLDHLVRRIRYSSLVLGVFLLMAIVTYTKIVWAWNEPWRDGVALWSEAIRFNPNGKVYYYNRGSVKLSQKRFEAGIGDLSRAIELDPNYYTAINNRGVCYLNLGRLEEALRDFNRAVEIRPLEPRSFFNRGLALEKKGAYGLAARDFRTVLTLDPSYPDAGRELERVEGRLKSSRQDG